MHSICFLCVILSKLYMKLDYHQNKDNLLIYEDLTLISQWQTSVMLAIEITINQ